MERRYHNLVMGEASELIKNKATTSTEPTSKHVDVQTYVQVMVGN